LYLHPVQWPAGTNHSARTLRVMASSKRNTPKKTIAVSNE